MHNWRRYPSKCYEFDENVRFGIWRSAVAPSDAAEENCNVDTQLLSLPCTKSVRYFRKFTSCVTFVADKFRAIFGLSMRNLTMLPALYSDFRKKNIGAHLLS